MGLRVGVALTGATALLQLGGGLQRWEEGQVSSHSPRFLPPMQTLPSYWGKVHGGCCSGLQSQRPSSTVCRRALQPERGGASERWVVGPKTSDTSPLPGAKSRVL